MKVIEINDAGFVWHVPLRAVADHRARYYAEKDPDTTYQEEFDYVMDDHGEGLDWFWNNMDFREVADEASLVSVPAVKKEPDPNAERRVVVVPDPAPEASQ